MNSLLDLCTSILQIDSRNSVGNVALARFVSNQLEEIGFDIDWQQARLCGQRQVNLIARLGPKRPKALLLNTHLDTVETIAEAWTETGGNPCNPVQKKGRLYGLGAADTKLALACQIAALQKFDITRLKRPLLITGTYGEEMGLIGVQKLIRSRGLNPEFVLNSEPTELAVSNGNFGFRIYRVAAFQLNRSVASGYHHKIRFNGKAAHSAVPKLGRSAIREALLWIRNWAPDAVIVEAHGGIAANITAAECVLDILSTERNLKGLKRHRGELLYSEYRSEIKVTPDLSRILSNLPAALLGIDEKRETTNLGTLHYHGGQFEAQVSHRFAPGLSPHKRHDSWVSEMAQLNGGGAYVALTLEKDNPAFKQKATRPFVRTVQNILKDMKKTTSPFLKPGCTEAMYFSRLGCDVLTIGPGESYGNVHAPNESVRIKQLREAERFYSKVIERFCF